MTFTPNLVAGLTITIIGSALLLDRAGVLSFRELVQYWPVLLTLFGISVIVQALRGDKAGIGARPIVGPGVIFLCVFVWLAMSSADDRRFVAAGSEHDNELQLVAVLGEDSRTSLAAEFRRAHMTSVMGRSRLDLRKAAIAADGTATVDVFGLMGGVEVIVPPTWTVDVQTTTVMGGVRDRRGLTNVSAEEWEKLSRRERRRLEREGLAPLSADPAAPEVAAAPVAPAARSADGTAPAATAPDANTGSPSSARIILRGVVVFGGLTIRS